MNSYEKDFYSWTQEQADLLRNGQFNNLDIPNLIEEIETMGRSEKRELESWLTILLLHLLKWKYQEVRRSRSWQLSIDEQRIQFEETLNENPGLKPELDEIVKKLTDSLSLKQPEKQKSVKPFFLNVARGI